MSSSLKNLPGPAELAAVSGINSRTLFAVNGHIHTPYSFSAFSEVEPIFRMAAEEGIEILGINDFYTTGGYKEFHDLAAAGKVFPLFNIEFISLDRNLQERGIRVNDPSNPGRIYFSGKGLDYPESMDAEGSAVVASVIEESHRQVKEMVIRTNHVLEALNCGITLDFNAIKREYARELVRERHIAKALRIAVFNKFPTTGERKDFLSALYDGKEPKADLENASSVEIEIRNNLLKAGGKAFVVEDEKAFLTVEAVIDLIQNAGGIPCYPVLLDDPKGNCTDFETDKDSLYAELLSRGIFCIELIPGRNDSLILTNFVRFFLEKGFVILFGTEHNTPDMAPLTVSCRHQVPLTEELRQIGSDGACIIAAHQYFRAQGVASPVPQWTSLSADERKQILATGRTVVQYFLNY
jgi:hypothetical protein